jgi:hypothetical protein
MKDKDEETLSVWLTWLAAQTQTSSSSSTSLAQTANPSVSLSSSSSVSSSSLSSSARISIDSHEYDPVQHALLNYCVPRRSKAKYSSSVIPLRAFVRIHMHLGSSGNIFQDNNKSHSSSSMTSPGPDSEPTLSVERRSELLAKLITLPKSLLSLVSEYYKLTDMAQRRNVSRKISKIVSDSSDIIESFPHSNNISSNENVSNDLSFEEDEEFRLHQSYMIQFFKGAIIPTKSRLNFLLMESKDHEIPRLVCDAASYLIPDCSGCMVISFSSL